jgi:parallel beta-helix repeat protein
MPQARSTKGKRKKTSMPSRKNTRKKSNNKSLTQKLITILGSRTKTAFVFAVLFGVVGVVFLIRSFAATTTVTYSGRLTTEKPLDSYTVATSAGTLSATVSSPARMKVTITNSSGAVLASAVNRKSATASTTVASGTYTVSVSSDENLGSGKNYRLSISWPVDDTTNPTAVIVNPVSSTVAGTINVNASATDDTGITKVEFYIDSNLVGTDTSSPYTYSWNTTTATNGSHTISIKAYDTSGNTGMASVNVTVENGTVTPPPTTACSGVSVTPGQFSQALVNNYPGGTTFCLKAGTHVMSGSGVLAKSNDSFIGEPGTILDGQNTATYGIQGSGGSTGQSYVTVRGLVFQRFTTSAIKAGWNWTIENNEITAIPSSGQGVQINNNGVLRGNRIHHNQWYAIIGGPGVNFLIENNEIDFNYLCNCKPGDDGASKLVGSGTGILDGVTWRGNKVHDNNGHAIWSDGNVKNVVYENNIVENNRGAGIFHEISRDAVIRNNTLRNNATDYLGKSCWHGAHIHINNSQNVQIYGNTIEDSRGGNLLCLLDTTRNEPTSIPQYLENISVHDNIFRLARSTTGLEYAGQVGMTGNANRGVTFDHNTYYVKNTSESHWAFIQYPLNWTTFKSKGQEATGTTQLW